MKGYLWLTKCQKIYILRLLEKEHYKEFHKVERDKISCICYRIIRSMKISEKTFYEKFITNFLGLPYQPEIIEVKKEKFKCADCGNGKKHADNRCEKCYRRKYDEDHKLKISERNRKRYQKKKKKP